MYRSKNNIILTILLLIVGIACRKAVSVSTPITSVNQTNIYSNDATAISVLTGIYTKMISTGSFFQGSSGISLLSGLSADELNLYSGVANTNTLYYYYTNTLFSNTSGTQGTTYWNPAYNYIFVCISILEGIAGSSALSSSVKRQLLGEAKFLRAFFYFYLINAFGDIPFETSTDWKNNSLLPRNSTSKIYAQVITDLKDAQSLLSNNYLDANLSPYPAASAERVRPTQWAATALLSRVYLYTNDYVDAEAQATVVINNSSLFSLPVLNAVFLKNSKESIWQLQPTVGGQSTQEALLFTLPSSGPNTSSNPVYLSPALLASFDSSDLRKVNGNWINSVQVGSTTYYYPYKYKAGKDASITTMAGLKEYLTVLRLGEQYLIRAEARAQQGNSAGAIADLNAIRIRAGLPAYTGPTTQAPLLSAIFHERQVELFTEWGHRWFDLKRSGSVDGVMTLICPQKGSNWNSYQQWYPIPFTDLQRDPNLTQNNGY